MSGLNFNEASRGTVTAARDGEVLLLRGMKPLRVFDVLLSEAKRGSIESRFEGAWWRLLADGRFFFEPARLNDVSSNTYILQGTYKEHHGAFFLQAENYRSPANLLTLEGVIRPENGQYALDCLFINEGSDSPILYLTQPLTTEDTRGMLCHSEIIKGVPVPALYDLELSGNTTSGAFSGIQACLRTVATMSDESAGKPDEIHFTISTDSVLKALAEENGTCSLLLPFRTFMDAALGILPSNWVFDMVIEDGLIQLHIEDISSYQSVFSWREVQELSAAADDPPRQALVSCSARTLSLVCRVTDDAIVGELRANGTTQSGQPAHYEALIEGRRAADEPQSLDQLEQKTMLLSQERSWRDRNIFDGDWQSERFGHLQMRQRGQAVTGTFSGQTNAVLDGVATEHRLTFNWRNENDAGQGLLYAVRGGQFLAGFFSRQDSFSPVVELLYRPEHSSRLVADMLRVEADPFEWNRQANSLKSLDRHGEALILYEKTFKAFGEKREQLTPYSESWMLCLSSEWGAVLDFMNCFQMQNFYLSMNVPPQFRIKTDEETTAFKRLLDAFKYAIQLQAELYAVTQKAEAEEGVIFPDFGAQLVGQIELWRRSLSDEASRMDVLELSQHALAELLKVLVSAGSYEQALVVAESARARAFSDLMQTRIALDQARASLPESSALDLETFLAGSLAATAPVELDMLRETARHQRSTIVEYFLRNDDLFIWIISPNGEINFHQHQQPGLQQSLTDLVAATRTSLGVQTREAVFKGVPQPPQQFLPRLAELYRLLVEPLKDWLPHNEHEPVIFIPHGILFMVPFPTLFDQQKYLIDRHTIAVAPSIRFVETTYQLAAGRKTYPPGILIVGDPLMPVWRADDDRPAERLPQLEFARKEAEEVARKLGATAVLGAQASKQKIVASLPQQQIIHLSTHGLLDAHRSPADMPGAIALAPEDEDDGFLTAAHIAALALQAKIVVMSACNTGQGRLSADGILGLVRAFLTAGAECVVASLWAVSDLSTQELMVEFYEHLLRGLPVGSALRQAMLTLKADERHAYPLYWAAFTVTGQSQRPLFDVIQDEAILSRQET